MNTFSIIIVTYKRCRLLQRCLQSILPKKRELGFEVIVVLNGKDNDTSLLLKNSFSEVKLLEVKKCNPGEARNKAVELVENEYIFFLDDDTIVPFDYFDQIKNIFKENENLMIFGGPDANYPNSGKWEKALSVALTSPLATANTRYRHMTGEQGHFDEHKKLILCNMWVKASIFKDGLTFDKRFFRNEENVFIHEAQSKGYNVKYFPKLFVYHKRRANLWALFRAVMLSGSGRLRSFFYYPNSFDPIYFVPFFFSTYVVILFLCETNYFFKLPFIIYLTINIYLSWKLSNKNRNSLFLIRVSFIQFIINFSYGIGFYLELIKKIIPKLGR